MFLAAALDAFPEKQEAVVSAMRVAGLPVDWQVEMQAAKDHGMAGARFKIVPPVTKLSKPTGTFLNIKSMLEQSNLTEAIKTRAVHVFLLLAEAEAKAHGVAVNEVHFHELADWDSVADIVGAACIMSFFPEVTWSVGPIPVGSGRVRTAHGPMPVPAPATTELLKGFRVIDDSVLGERVTPTGAAILKALAPEPHLPKRQLMIVQAGQGFGTKVFPELTNMLRVLVYSDAEDNVIDADLILKDQVAVIRFEVDDQTPEDLAIALRIILDLETVKDVCQWPVYSKKGRLASAIQVLCDVRAVKDVAKVCLLQTTTIGLRYQIEDRLILERDEQIRSFEQSQLKVKKVMRPNGNPSFKIDADDLAKHSQNQLERRQLRSALESDTNDE